MSPSDSIDPRKTLDEADKSGLRYYRNQIVSDARLLFGSLLSSLSLAFTAIELLSLSLTEIFYRLYTVFDLLSEFLFGSLFDLLSLNLPAWADNVGTIYLLFGMSAVRTANIYFDRPKGPGLSHASPGLLYSNKFMTALGKIRSKNTFSKITVPLLLIPVWPYAILNDASVILWSNGKIMYISYRKFLIRSIFLSFAGAGLIIIANAAPNAYTFPEKDNSVYKQAQVTVTAKSGLNLREAPSTDSRILLSIPYGETVTVIDAPKNDWQKVRYNRKIGFVYDKWIK